MECFLERSEVTFVEASEYLKYLTAIWLFVSFVFVLQRREIK